MLAAFDVDAATDGSGGGWADASITASAPCDAAAVAQQLQQQTGLSTHRDGDLKKSVVHPALHPSSIHSLIHP